MRGSDGGREGGFEALDPLPKREVTSIQQVRPAGFDPAAVRVGGLGLVTMRERAELIGATLTIRSRLDHGTKVGISVTADPTRRDT